MHCLSSAESFLITFIQEQSVLRLIYSVTNRSRTVCPFCLNGDVFRTMEKYVLFSIVS